MFTGLDLAPRAAGWRNPRLNDAGVLAIVTALAVISGVLTFILFRFLDAKAEGKGKLLGGTIRYGGSLAGFVLLFSILFGAFYKLRPNPGVMTPVSLAGDWDLQELTSTGKSFKGSATIRQQKNDPILEMGGEIVGGKSATFTTMYGVIRDRNVYLIYENIDGERGIIRGQVTTDAPTKLTLIYTDLIGHDRNNDPTGTLVLTKRK
jgi:hypothetical protein